MTNQYKSLWHIFWGICVFKNGPQDVAISYSLIKWVFIGYVTVGAVLFFSSTPTTIAIVISFTETILLTGFVYLLLSLFAVSERFLQTITALYGTGAIITSLSVPIVFYIDESVRHEQSAGIAGLLLLAVVCWSYTIMAHILHKAIEKSLGVSLLLTFCYLYLSYKIISVIFPSSFD